jgi:tetratricopeptide (TPR) repeat protein
MVSYVKRQGFNIDAFIDGNEDKRIIKYFLAQKLPVLVPIGNVRMGHMVVLVGYDDSKRIFSMADPGWRELQEWRYFDFNEWHRYPGNLGFLVYPKSMDFLTIAYYTKIIENDPKSSEAYNNRGNAYCEKGFFEQAISDFERALEINPKYAIVYNNLAWILSTANKAVLQDGGKAVELALKACELSNWKKPEYLSTLAAAYARAGDFNNAVKWQEKAMEFPEVGNKRESHLRLQFYKKGRPWPPNI